MKKCYLIPLLFSLGCNAQEKEIVKSYYPSGELRSTTEMLNGKKNGKETLYQKNGDFFMIQFYKDNLYVDSAVEFQNNKPFLKGIVEPMANIKFYTISNGNLFSENQYDSRNLGQGIVKLYHDNNVVGSLSEYKDSKRNGIHVFYFPNGNIKRIEHYQAGVKIPPIIVFDSTGKVVHQELK